MVDLYCAQESKQKLNHFKGEIKITAIKRTDNTKKALAAIMTGLIMASTVSALSVTSVGAATAPRTSVSASDIINSESNGGADVFFKGTDGLLKLLKLSNPVASTVGSGILDALKLIYGAAFTNPQPSTQDIVNLLNELSDKIDRHYNEQSRQVKALECIQKLQNVSMILTSAKGYNQESMGQISLYDEKSVCAQDYINIIKCTVENNSFTKDYRNLSNLIIDGQAGEKGLPTFEQYLELSKSVFASTNDAAAVKKDCENFNKMTMEMYALYTANLLTGYSAQYQLAELDYKSGKIDEATKNSRQKSIMKSADTMLKLAANVSKQYESINSTVKNVTAAKVTVNGKTTEYFSFGDAWEAVSQNGGTLQLTKDWVTDNFAADTFFYKEAKGFKDGALYINDKKVVFDLNGFSIRHSKARGYDIIAEKSDLTVKDSTGKHGAIGGISVKDGNTDINGITVQNCTESGLHAVKTVKYGSLKVSNTIFRGNKMSGLYNESFPLTVDNCKFEENSTTGDGGAIHCRKADLIVQNCEFYKNNAVWGGTICSHNHLTVNNCVFRDNTAKEGGGAIKTSTPGAFITGHNKYVINDSVFIGNSCGGCGGAIYIEDADSLKLSNIEITYNTAGQYGAGLYVPIIGYLRCNPVISGKIVIIGNKLQNGKNSNVFLGDSSLKKCIFHIYDRLDQCSKIGVTSNTTDRWLTIAECHNKEAFDSTENVFSYDTDAYRINRYSHWYESSDYVEIVKN